MNVIGNRCTAQTNFHKPHCRGEHYSPHPFNSDAGAHCAPLRDLANDLEYLALDHSEFASEALLERRFKVVLGHQPLDIHP